MAASNMPWRTPQRIANQPVARNREQIAKVSGLLAYNEDEAGGLMSPRFARLRPDMRIDAAIAYLRCHAGQVETIYHAYAGQAWASVFSALQESADLGRDSD